MADQDVRLVDTLTDVPAEVSRILGYSQDVGFDLETTDTDPINSKIVSIAFKPKGRRALVIDVRQWDELRLLALGGVLQPLFGGVVKIVGQNLKFDLEFMFAQLGIQAHNVYDTMLADQVILGLGISSAAEKGIHFSLLDIAERYGLEVEKESRSYFIALDQREEWNEPLPPEQLRYIRQDVSVVHKIKEAQTVLIEQAGLGEVIDLEMRALLPLAGIEVFGVQINREGWLAVIDRVADKARELEAVLHLGSDGVRRLREGFEQLQREFWQQVHDGGGEERTWGEYREESMAWWDKRHEDLLRLGEFEGLDVHILKVRHEKYMEKWVPYERWMKQRDEFIASQKTGWELGDLAGKYKNWSECKKASLEWWYEQNGRLVKPPTNKAGVNLGSWMQVRDGFNDLGLMVQSVSEDDLAQHRSFHPLVGIYIEWSHARKIVTVYGRERGKKNRSFIEMLDSSDRLRASYQQIGADTGRMSSYNPNFQQIPTDGIGAELRRNVIAAPGYTLVVADFSNIELRIVAELSGDRFLLDAFASGEDVHAYTAKVMFDLDRVPEYVEAIARGEDPKKWTNKTDAVIGGRTLENTSYRKISKTINYMLLYGAGVKRLASMLNVEERDAKTLLQTYYETFSTAIGWLNAQKERLTEAKNNHQSRVFAVTRSGRRRYFDIPHYPKHPANGKAVTVDAHEKWVADVEEWRKKNASIKRQLANTPIQGLSADITKEAAALWYEEVGYDNAMRLVAVIHDEFILEVRPGYTQEAKTILHDVMCQAMLKYLRVVDLGDVDPVQTNYWMH